MNLLLAFHIPIPSPHLSIVFALSLGICAFLTWLVLKNQRNFGVDLPDGGRKSHAGAISRLGGLPIFITMTMGLIYTPFGVQQGAAYIDQWWPIVVCLVIIFTIGFADDLKPLGARVKLLGQVGAACILYAAGYSIDFLTHPTNGEHIALGWWAFPITIFWLVAIPNIINLIDGMDGLAGGFGLFMCLTLGVVGHFSGMPDIVMMSAVMAGALGGFLFFNFPPAKIFLGDGGAYLIGFFIAALSLASSHKGTIVGSLLVMIVAMGIPILDTAFAIARRAVRGVPLFKADAEHIHHRLILLGYSKGQALLVLYIACVILSLGGITILLSRGFTAVIAGAALVVVALVAARYLGYIRSWSMVRRQMRVALTHRRDLEYIRAYGRLLEMEALRTQTREEFSHLLMHAIGRAGFDPMPADSVATISVPAGEKWIWHLGFNAEAKDRNLALRHAGELAEAVALGLERWQDLPGLKLIAREATPDTSPAEPNNHSLPTDRKTAPHAET